MIFLSICGVFHRFRFRLPLFADFILFSTKKRFILNPPLTSALLVQRQMIFLSLSCAKQLAAPISCCLLTNFADKRPKSTFLPWNVSIFCSGFWQKMNQLCALMKLFHPIFWSPNLQVGVGQVAGASKHWVWDWVYLLTTSAARAAAGIEN